MPDDIRTQLEAAGLRLAAADTERSAAIAELATLVREAVGQVPIAEIARLGRISRPTVYTFIREDTP